MKFQINHNSNIPLHYQVEELLRKMIASPDFKNGALFPKEVEMANRLGVSRNTVRQATNKLQHEGLITRKKGVGTKLTDKKPLATGLDHWYSFTEEMKEKGIDVINLGLTAEWVVPEKKIADFFTIPKNKKILKLSKLKGTQGDPIVYFESYFHPRIGVNEKDDFDIPLYTMLERKYGVIVVRSVENISARRAGTIGKKLKIQSGEPVLYRERFVHDIGDRPIEYNVGYYRSDKFVYSIDINKSGARNNK
jgi:GntR family transcriptional regulator